jgi:hypothetical protein
MHKMLTRLLAVAALVCTAGTAGAVTWPNATCPDSVTIPQIQNYNPNACLAAVGDTVMGVGGIIIGFDPIATGFDAFIQHTVGGPFSGIDVFFHSKNPQSSPYNLAIGDSIVVEWMRVGEFGGATQVLAPNNNFTAPNGIIRKVSSGNPLPPFFVGSTTQLKEVPATLPAFSFAEQYEGCLVKITDQTVVGRTSLQVPGIGQNNAFLIVDPNAPSDSVFIDGNKLTTYAPPPVGTPILSVQGILNQTSRGYRIMLRNGNDIIVNTPPNVIDAYPITDNIIRVMFDRDVTVASATNTSNYSLASFGSIDAVAMNGTSAVNVTVTNGLAHGDIEVITVNGVTGLAANQTMTTPQSRTFVNGLLTAEEVQRANPDSLAGTPCVDRSRFAGPGGQISQGPVGTKASMAATISGVFGALYYTADPTDAKRTGVAAFSPPATLTLGRKYRLSGGIQEFFGETEFSNITEVQDLGVGALPAVKVLTVAQARADTCDFTNSLNDGEDWEGRIVQLKFVKVVQRFSPLPTNGFHVADQSFPDTIFVQNLSGVLNPFTHPPLGQLYSITGALHYESGSFRVAPRSYADIVDHGVAGVGGGGANVSFAIAGNPSQRPTFHWTLPVAAEVDIGIFDVAGRQVASIQSGQMGAGAYSREWAGTDDSGQEVNAGVYFARLKTNGASQTLRTVFLGR